ncbi:RNA polymerase sigma factor [Bizionia myxarmorum]|uniref:Sigma-70 family RNA polymerase sigma factor n=1 Tax=Bizionia myxarmorum TaxID=291186 RepID=A0A5D0R2V3_9FLAO|nr:sigma-70 family RNA polymerase sigma factor [Bizionia myxarmorum]TYB75903.1 sigma-70 family RNA polymerase sigma factor [Bizionia myxarmorum]
MNEESHIIELLKKGDEKTIHFIYNEYKPGFLMFAGRYTLSKDDLLDVYQDAIVALCENARKGNLDELKSSIKTYFFSIGKYMIYAQLKKRNQTTTYENIDNFHFEWDDYDENITNVQLVRMREVFRDLGEQCKKVLSLFYYEEKKLEEITQLMNYENKNVAKSQKSRCIKKLRDLTIKKK